MSISKYLKTAIFMGFVGAFAGVWGSEPKQQAAKQQATKVLSGKAWIKQEFGEEFLKYLEQHYEVSEQARKELDSFFQTHLQKSLESGEPVKNLITNFKAMRGSCIVIPPKPAGLSGYFLKMASLEDDNKKVLKHKAIRDGVLNNISRLWYSQYLRNKNSRCVIPAKRLYFPQQVPGLWCAAVVVAEELQGFDTASYDSNAIARFQRITGYPDNLPKNIRIKDDKFLIVDAELTSYSYDLWKQFQQETGYTEQEYKISAAQNQQLLTKTSSLDCSELGAYVLALCGGL